MPKTYMDEVARPAFRIRQELAEVFWRVFDRRPDSARRESLRMLRTGDLRGRRFSGCGFRQRIVQPGGAAVARRDGAFLRLRCRIGGLQGRIRRRYFPEDECWKVELGSVLDTGVPARPGAVRRADSCGAHIPGRCGWALENITPLVSPGRCSSPFTTTREGQPPLGVGKKDLQPAARGACASWWPARPWWAFSGAGVVKDVLCLSRCEPGAWKGRRAGCRRGAILSTG